MLKNVEDRKCRYYYAHENITLLERSKVVANTEDLTKIKNLLTNTDVIASCTREPANLEWKLYKLTSVAILATLIKKVPLGCKDTVLPDPPLSVRCLTFEENTRTSTIYVSLELRHCICIERRDSRTRLPNYSIYSSKKTGGTHPANFRGVCMEDIAAVEDSVQADIFLYDFDILDGSMIGEFARKSVRKHSNTVRLISYISHICSVSNINALFKAYRCPSCDQFIKTAQYLEQHLTTCKERVKHVFPKKYVHSEKHCLTN